MRHPVVDEQTDVGVTEEVPGLQGLGIRGHDDRGIGRKWRCRVGRAAGKKGVVHQGNVGEGRGG